MENWDYLVVQLHLKGTGIHISTHFNPPSHNPFLYSTYDCLAVYLITLTSFARRNEGLQGSQESDWWISLDMYIPWEFWRPHNATMQQPPLGASYSSARVNKCASIHSLSQHSTFSFYLNFRFRLTIDGSHVLSF